ncbi:hypothetical protein [Nitrospira sp. Nam74]
MLKYLGLLPREVAQVHLQRAREALNQQIAKALTLAFGDDSLPLHQFQGVGFLTASPVIDHYLSGPAGRSRPTIGQAPQRYDGRS